MFHIVNDDNATLSKTENLKDAKELALRMKEETGENFRIFKWEWIWSTKTLNER